MLQMWIFWILARNNSVFIHFVSEQWELNIYFMLWYIMNLCDHKNIFGEPGKGVHRYRLFNIAIVDVVATILLALLIHYILNMMYHNISFRVILISLFVVGIVIHRLFCVRTTIDKMLFKHHWLGIPGYGCWSKCVRFGISQWMFDQSNDEDYW